MCPPRLFCFLLCVSLHKIIMTTHNALVVGLSTIAWKRHCVSSYLLVVEIVNENVLSEVQLYVGTMASCFQWSNASRYCSAEAYTFCIQISKGQIQLSVIQIPLISMFVRQVSKTLYYITKAKIW